MDNRTLDFDTLIKKAADDIVSSRKTIALTGAGISVESGIPDFRSEGGLWSRFDPMEYAHINAFMSNPVKVWEMLKEMTDLVLGAEFNPGHFARQSLRP